MKKIFLLLIPFLFVNCSEDEKLQITPDNKFSSGPSFEDDVKSTLDFIGNQYQLMLPNIPDGKFPRSTNIDGSLKLVKANSWTSGFYPGILWYLYEYTSNDIFLHEAKRKTLEIENQKTNTGTHDLGFMLYNSFGNGYRITGNEHYRNVLETGSVSLSSRFNKKVCCIKSWDWASQWQFPVIIDNMMNLEYLFWATKVTGDSTYYQQATAHAKMTIKNHFRNDNSSFHVIDFDPNTGKVLEKTTHQGYSAESSWARGQAWGLYGFTMLYRETNDIRYLDQANKIAQFILNHPNLPEDKIPFWDFDAPDIPNTVRDVSAATITASALIELQSFVDGELQLSYISSAETILKSLMTENFLVQNGDDSNFALKHSTGSFPAKSEIDTEIIYADYYFVEALIRYLEML